MMMGMNRSPSEISPRPSATKTSAITTMIDSRLKIYLTFRSCRGEPEGVMMGARPFTQGHGEDIGVALHRRDGAHQSEYSRLGQLGADMNRP